MIKRYGGLLLLMLFPIIGFMGMVLILREGQTENQREFSDSTLQQFPTPLPILTTPVPTVTVVPIIDHPVPPATLVTLAGDEFTLDEFKGEIVILNFWATWCPPCVEEMPLLRDYAAEHEEIRVVAVTAPEIGGQSVEMIEAFIEANDLKMLTIGLDANGYLQGTMGAMGLPTTFILDREGIVRFQKIGVISAEELDYYRSELN